MAVCDQIGGLAYDAGVLNFFRDARARLLGPDGVLVPASFALYLVTVTTDFWRDAVGIWGTRPAGFDVSPMLDHAAGTDFRINLAADDFLAEPAPLADVAVDCNDPILGDVELRIAESPGCSPDTCAGSTRAISSLRRGD